MVPFQNNNRCSYDDAHTPKIRLFSVFISIVRISFTFFYSSKMKFTWLSHYAEVVKKILYMWIMCFCWFLMHIRGDAIIRKSNIRKTRSQIHLKTQSFCDIFLRWQKYSSCFMFDVVCVPVCARLYHIHK